MNCTACSARHNLFAGRVSFRKPVTCVLVPEASCLSSNLMVRLTRERYVNRPLNRAFPLHYVVLLHYLEQWLSRSLIFVADDLVIQTCGNKRCGSNPTGPKHYPTTVVLKQRVHTIKHIDSSMLYIFRHSKDVTLSFYFILSIFLIHNRFTQKQRFLSILLLAYLFYLSICSTETRHLRI